MFQERIGVVQRYDEKTQTGIIVCEEVNGVADRFFIHGSNIVFGPVSPKIGQACKFKFDPSWKVKHGWLPKAQAIRIEESTAEIVASTLAGEGRAQ